MDLAVLEGLRELQDEGEPDLLADLVEMFLDDASSRISSLRDAVERGDAKAVESLAHSLKGSCGNMGVREMYAISADLQEAGASGDLSEAAGLVENLERGLEKTRPALAKALETQDVEA